MTEQYRAVAHVDLAAIAHNIATLRKACDDRAFMAVVKANGYGHGMLPVARTAREAGADYLGVAYPVEALTLRADGDRGPLLTWLYTPQDDLVPVIEQSVELGVSSLADLTQVAAAAEVAGNVPGIHLKIDTGLGRNGAMPTQWPGLLQRAAEAQRAGRVKIKGIWSHLASADELQSPVTELQLTQFDMALAMAEDLGIRPDVRHIANTAGALAWPKSHYDLVRCGIGIYGLSPGPELGTSAALGLVPAMTLSADIALVKSVPAGQGVSYGHRYHTESDTTLALVPIGYGDGVPRSGSNRIPVQLNGRRYVVAGTIAMDQLVLDVGDAHVTAGDTVTLFGGGDLVPSAQDWANASDTINYEIVTRITDRVPRVYSASESGPRTER